MGNRHSREKKNNLELYLNDVYEKECKFKIEEEEVEFIKTGIEELVQDIVDHIVDFSFNNTISLFGLREYSLIFTTDIIGKVGIPTNRYMKNYFNPGKCTIIKVGSFYDGTKNNLPDEFDFIFPILGTSEAYPSSIEWAKMFLILEIKVLGSLEYKRNEESLKSYTGIKQHQQTMNIRYVRFCGEHGPAFKFMFVYTNGYRKRKIYICVDLVPAYKIFRTKAVKTQGYRCEEPEEFRKAESILIVGKNLAFTEVEKYFMRNISSKKHVKVNRILKYLINGHGDGEILRKLNREHAYYNSYHIKTLMIYHHEAYTHTDTEDLGPCVLQVLQELSVYQFKKEFPWSIRKPYDYSYDEATFIMLQDLKSTIKALELKQSLNGSYDYEREKVMSVARQYWMRKSRKHKQNACYIS